MYPSVAAAGRELRARTAIVDGEIVAVDATGHPSFQALQHRSAYRDHTIAFYAFDLLHVDGTSLLDRVLTERRAQLTSVISGSGLLLSEELHGRPSEIIDAVRGLGLEGIVAKRRDSRYVSGQRTDAWQKLKLEHQQEFVIGGYRPGRHGVDALPVGFYEGTPSRLRSAGTVSGGLHAARASGGVRTAPRAARAAVSVRRSAEQPDVSLEWRHHGGADGRDAVGDTYPGRPDPIRRVDGGRPPATRSVRRAAQRARSLGTSGARRPAWCERPHRL